MSAGPAPDFLCIGAQKAGTSWLHHNLAQQTRVWVPPVKELHYFGTNPKDRLLARLRATRPSYRKAMRLVARGAVGLGSREQRQTAAWAVRFLLAPRSDRSYAALFTANGDLVRGEVTPTYAVLPEPEIERIARLNPAIRIVYLVRNPIDRAWSEVNMHVQKRSLRVDFLGCGRLERALLEEPDLLAHSDYVGNLERWGRFVPPEQIHVAFFDLLVEEPGRLLRGVCQFLGLTDEEIHIPPDVGLARNARHHPAIPAPASQVLAQVLGPHVAEQQRFFDNRYTSDWLEAVGRQLA